MIGSLQGTAGYLSYSEIKGLLARTGVKPVYDKETMTKYVRYVEAIQAVPKSNG